MVNIEFRKLIKFGKNSIVISLPNKWITKNKLKKGDSVSVEDMGDGLYVSAGSMNDDAEEKRITINIDKKDIDLIRIEVISSYLNNYETIEIIGKDLTERAEEIKEIVRSLSGIEVIHQTSTKIVAKDILDDRSISIEIMIKRIDMIVRGMIDDSIQTINKDLYTSVFQRDVDVNRLVFLTYRVLRNALSNSRVANSLDLKPVDILRNWLVIESLEQIGDHNKRIARSLSKGLNKGCNKRQLEKLYLDLKKTYVDVMNAYYKNNKESAFMIELKSKERVDALDEYIEKNEPCETLSRVIKNMKSMSSSIKSIARTVIGTE